MNNKQEFIDKLKMFLESDDKVMLITGTHQYKKHKILVAFLDKYYKNNKVLFRTNALQNLTNTDFMGFADLKRQPKAGELIRINNNIYSFDSFTRGTWSKSGSDNDFAILYPVDALLRSENFEAIEDIIKRSNRKVFLVTWTDVSYKPLEQLKGLYDVYATYDALEENKEYHERVLNCSR